MWKWLIEFIVGLFRGWYGERSRDQAHEDKGRAEANLDHEKAANQKINAADAARHNVDADGVSMGDDPNNRDN